MRAKKTLLAVVPLVLAGAVAAGEAEEPVTIRIGSKTFTESVLLGEMIKHLAAATGHRTYHRRELGGTRVTVAR